MLDVCVCGWYLDKYDDFYMSLHRLNKKYPVFVVSNKDSEYLETIDLPHVVRENTGLEWGAYNYFLMNVWKGQNGVLFCHDDITLNPTAVEGQIHPPEYLFDRIEELKVDQAYIFGSRHEDVENYGKHGRMVYMGRDFLQRIKEAGGFWYDNKNQGYTSGDDAYLKEQYGCFGYNAGINCFHDQTERIGGDVRRKVYIPSFSLARRGERGNATVAYGQWSEKVGQIIKAAPRKLHLGCGDNHWPEYTNVDLHSDRADIKAPADNLPFEDGFYDLIEAHHLIEHLAKEEVETALEEWRRVLSPAGHIFLSCPDIMADFDLLKEAQSPELWDGMMQVIYGEPGPGMAHRYGYSRDSMTRLLTEAGFEDVDVKTVIGYRPTPSMLAIARRGNKVVKITPKRKMSGVTAPYVNEKRTYCEVLRDIYDIIQARGDMPEVIALLEEAYGMGKKMDAKLRQYKNGYDDGWYEETKNRESKKLLKGG